MYTLHTFIYSIYIYICSLHVLTTQCVYIWIDECRTLATDKKELKNKPIFQVSGTSFI